MTRSLTALLLASALAASPALAAKHHMMAHHGSSASADNMADQLNGTSLADTQAGKDYTPTPSGASAAPAGGEKPMHGMMHHRAHHMKKSAK